MPPGGRHCLWTSVPRAQAHFRTIGVCGAETFAVFRSDGWWRYSAWVLVRCVSRNAPMGGAVLFEEKGTCKLGRYHEQQPCTPPSHAPCPSTTMPTVAVWLKSLVASAKAAGREVREPCCSLATVSFDCCSSYSSSCFTLAFIVAPIPAASPWCCCRRIVLATCR